MRNLAKAGWILIGALLVTVVVIVALSGCTTEPEPTPRPPVVEDYNVSIQGTWTGFKAKNLNTPLKYTFKPNKEFISYTLNSGQWLVNPAASGKYQINDNKTLVLTCTEVTSSVNITIQGDVMTWNWKKSDDGWPYTIVVYFKRVSIP